MHVAKLDTVWRQNRPDGITVVVGHVDRTVAAYHSDHLVGAISGGHRGGPRTARLLGGKELVPERVELQQRLPNFCLGDVRRLFACGAPRADDDLGLPEDAEKLVNDRSLDLRGRHPAYRTRLCPRFSTSWLTPHALVALVALVRPNEGQRGAGERWFCDEAEAIGAGWLAARFR